MNKESNQEVVIYFVPRSKVQPALAAMQTKYGHGFSWVRACDYLKTDDTFAVQVVFSDSYPFLQDDFKQWEQP